MVIGCTAAVLSSACQSIGLVLQRKAHLISQTSQRISGVPSSPYRRSLWHIGFLLFIFANIFGSTIQIVSLPLIVLSPLQSLGLMFNTLFGSLILDESFTLYSLVGTLLVAFGAFCIAFWGGDLPQPSTDLNTFANLLTGHSFILWSTMCLLVSFTMLIWNLSSTSAFHYIKLMPNSDTTRLLSTVYPIKSLNNLKSCQGILYGCVSGIFSAGSLLLAKSSMDILTSVLINHHLSILNTPLMYLIVAGFLTLCLAQLYLLNQGLKFITTSVLYPLVFCVYNITSVGNSLTFYQQWSVISKVSFTCITLGTLMVIAGVVFLGKGINSPKMDISNTNKFHSSLHSSLSHRSSMPYYGSTADSLKSSNDDVSLPLETSTICSAEGVTPIEGRSEVDNELGNSVDASNVGSRSFSSAHEFFSPLIKSTTENLNSAGRKMTGFLKKSIGSLHGGLRDNGVQFKTSSRRATPNTSGRDDSEPSEYISFGSLNDTSSFINNYDAVESTNPNHSPVSKGTNTVRFTHQPRSSHKHFPPSRSSQSLHMDYRRDKDNLRLSQLDPVAYPHGRKPRNRSSSHKLYISTKLPHEQRGFDAVKDNRLDNDYNPNNMFNYSLSNTIEEIQSQMNDIDDTTSRICSGALDMPDDEDQPQPTSKQQVSKTEISPPISRYQSLRSDTLHVPKRGNKVRSFTTGILRNARSHRRDLSFEQTELLNELGRK